MSLLLSNMVRLKRFLRKYPRAYSQTQKMYYRLLYVGETSFLGSKFHEWIWRRQSAPQAEEFQDVVEHPHRDFLVSQIMQSAPFERVLEIGCNAGQNLYLLARKYPGASFHGIDINPHFVEAGQDWLRRRGVENVFLRVGKADDLSSLGDRSYDICFSDATLMYLGPDKISKSLRHIVRITRKAILLNEWSQKAPERGKRSLWYDFHWVHDYSALFRDFLPQGKIRETKIPAGQWLPGGGWEKYGTLIEVEL
jgi:SAM-dependent methyltransferase